MQKNDKIINLEKADEGQAFVGKPLTREMKNEIINAFVSFYGEKYRRGITERLKEIDFIVLNSTCESKSDICHKKDFKQKCCDEVVKMANRRGAELSESSKVFVAEEVPIFTGNNGSANFLIDKNNNVLRLVTFSGYDVTLRTVIHELNHSLFASYEVKDGTIYEKKGALKGVFAVDDIIKVKENSEEYNKYKMLNEVITDYFAVKMCKTIEKGCDGEDSSYKKYWEDFGAIVINNNLEDFKMAFMSSKENAFEQIFGKENVSKMAFLLNARQKFVEHGVCDTRDVLDDETYMQALLTLNEKIKKYKNKQKENEKEM